SYVAPFPLISSLSLHDALPIFVVVATIYALRLFTEVYVTTKGGPFGATRTVIYLVWEEGVAFRHTGYAAALAVLFFLLVLAITLDRKSTRLNSSHQIISYAVFC